jgi:RHS repeat-associated protein
VASATEYDALGRPLKSIAAVGTPLEIWIRTEYDDVARRVIVRSDLETKGDGKKVAVQHYDQLGRVSLSRSIENIATEDPYNETHGIKVQTRYQTGNPNSYQLTSNPYRAATATAATNEPTMGWTRSMSVNTGRHAETETFSGASLPAPWGSNTTSTGKVLTDTEANATTVTDQAGKLRRSITNALGQLIRVDEPTSSNQLGTVGSPIQPTAYTYDTLNNLMTVTQAGSGTEQCGPNGGTCSQTRTFSYSSLSRLLSATNPESGTINYGYDPNGNLTRKTDARGVQTDYIYDALNRVTNRNYSTPGGTPPNYRTTPNVTYTYDNPLIANSKGKLTKVTNGSGLDRSTTENTAFDTLGRVLSHKQTTDGQNYTTGYLYNLSGALIEETYPSGRVVKNVLDNEGDIAQVQSKENASDIFRPYANNFVYSAAGAVSSLKLGNGKFENTQFNSRLQPTQIGLGASASTQNLLKLNFDYGTTDNNGNVKSQTITVPTVGAVPGFIATQNYTYDSLNRINQATETIPSQTGWQQTFVYDRYGNRRFDTTVNATTTLDPNCPTAVCNPEINTANNRLIGYVFDASGNTTTDASGQTFIYDAENKQVQVNDANGIVGQYFYDGDGKRIKKIVPNTGETTVFVYDAGGKLVAEYSTIVASSSEAQTSYLTNDHLGSPRITTDQFGQTISKRDFMPFGEEISRANYGNDSIRQKFTGYERDAETDLDFAQARYHAPNLGRFSSPDPLMASAKRVLPQSWNRYLYVINNPLKYVDPSGMVWGERTVGDTTHYCYAPGKAVCKGYTRYKGDGIIGNASVNGQFRGAIRLLPGGRWEDVVRMETYDGRWTWLNAKDAEAINAIIGGATCSLSGGLACPNAGEPIADKVAAAADTVQIVFLIRSLLKAGVSLAAIAILVKKNPEDIAAALSEELVKKYKNLECKDCADDMMQTFSAAGLTPTMRELSSNSDFIVRAGQNSGEAVSRNGRHFGVQVGDLIYDLYHPKGIPVGKWKDAYHSRSPLELLPLKPQ